MDPGQYLQALTHQISTLFVALSIDKVQLVGGVPDLLLYK